MKSTNDALKLAANDVREAAACVVAQIDMVSTFRRLGHRQAEMEARSMLRVARANFVRAHARLAEEQKSIGGE